MFVFMRLCWLLIFWPYCAYLNTQYIVQHIRVDNPPTAWIEASIVSIVFCCWAFIDDLKKLPEDWRDSK